MIQIVQLPVWIIYGKLIGNFGENVGGTGMQASLITASFGAKNCSSSEKSYLKPDFTHTEWKVGGRGERRGIGVRGAH